MIHTLGLTMLSFEKTGFKLHIFIKTSTSGRYLLSQQLLLTERWCEFGSEAFARLVLQVLKWQNWKQGTQFEDI